MAALDFPNSPSNGDTFTSPNGGAVYTWDGTKWLTTSVASNTAGQNNVGRNLLHNPMFNVGQRGSGPWTVVGNYTADRWQANGVTDAFSFSRFALADSDRTALGDEAVVALANTFTGNAAAGAYHEITQPIEGVRRLGGKTVTISFWAIGSATQKLGINATQNFGTGGSPSAVVNVLTTGLSVTLSTTWTRYSVTIALPSTTGKTLGTNGNDHTDIRFGYSSGATFNAFYGNIGVQSGSVNLWGVQAEVGSAATTLERQDPQQDLARCQRFFVNLTSVTFPCGSVAGIAYSTSMLWPTTMRAVPSVTLSGFTYSGASAAALSVATTTGFYLSATSAGGAGTFASGVVNATADL